MSAEKSEEIPADRLARGERLQGARKARRLTQGQLAQSVDCDPMTISRVERGTAGLGRRLRKSIEVRLGLAEGVLALPDEVEEDAPVARGQSDRYGEELIAAEKEARRRKVSGAAIRIVAAGVQSEGGGKTIDAAHLTSMMVAVDEALRRGGGNEPDEATRRAAVPKMGSGRKRS